MKNHKGAIATLLTLGLVVVGTLITLGSSLFINNQKTNLASNSMAYTNPCYSFRCPENSAITAYKRGGTIYKYSDCTGALPYAQICYPPSGGGTSGGTTGTGSSLPVGTAAGTCPYQTEAAAKKACGSLGLGYTQSGCRGRVAWQCKPATIVQPPNASGDDGSGNNGTGGSGEVGPGQSCCFRKKGLIYVYGRYDDMVNGDMNLNCAAHSVERSYQADGPAFVCDGGIQNQTPEGEIDPADLDGGIDTPINLCEDQGYICVDTVGKSAVTACTPDQYVKGVSCGDTTKVCCTGPGGGTVGGGTTGLVSRTGKLGEPCLFGTFQGRSNVYYCINPGVVCSSQKTTGVCVTQSTGGTVGSCVKKSCQALEARYANKNYYEKNNIKYDGNNISYCTNNTADKVIGNIITYCTEQVGLQANLDKECKQKSGDPLAFCPPPTNSFPCFKDGFERSNSFTCGNWSRECCVQKKAAIPCVKKNCQSLNTGYLNLGYYDNNGVYYSNSDLNSCSNNITSKKITDLITYCTQTVGFQASADNTCKQQTSDPLAYCNNVLPLGQNTVWFRNLPCKDGFEQSSARCGITKTICCMQKQQQAQENMTVPLADDCFEQNGETYCPVN